MPASPFNLSLPAELTQAELAHCTELVGNSRWSAVQAKESARRGSAIILAFASHIQAPWLLGASAAMHNMPLVVAGLGTPGGWPWYYGATPKLPASRRAAQLLRALTPAQPVALVDSFDVLVANHPPLEVRTVLTQLGDDEVIVGGECTMFPRCRAEELRALPSWRTCYAEGHNACSPNGGFILGRPYALQRLLDAMMGLLAAPPGNEPLAERFTSRHDQGALQQLLIAGGAGVRLIIDSASRLVLNLHACAARWNRTHLIKGFAKCHERWHVPLSTVEVPNASALLHWPRGRSAGRRRRPAEPVITRRRSSTHNADASYGGGAVRPLLLHANGNHPLLRHPTIRPIVESFNFSEASMADWPPRVLEAPVLLVDSVQHGLCAVVTLRSLMTRQ